MRSLIVLAAAMLLSMASVSAVQSETPLEHTHEISPGIYSFGGGNGYHSMFMVTDDGVVSLKLLTPHTEKSYSRPFAA